MLSDRRPDQEKSFFVLLDSNAWFHAGFLRSFQGVNLISLLFRTNSKLILPEIVEREVRRLYRSEIQATVDKAKEALARVESLTDVPTKFTPPDSEIAHEKMNDLLSELAPVLERPSFTLEHAVFALEMIFAKQAPCGPENEQFRDCCIWRDCIEYGKKRKTLLVSGDKAFYKGKKYENGLADNLSQDLAAQASTVEIFSDFTSLYKTLEPVTYEDVSESIAIQMQYVLGGEIVSALTRHGFIRATAGKHRIGTLRASQPTYRFVSFEYDFPLEGPSGDTTRLNPILTFSGSCAYNIATRTVSDVVLDSAVVAWTGIDGKRVEFTTPYLRVTESVSASTAPSFAPSFLPG